MWWLIGILVVLVAAFVVWSVRTPLFRAHRGRSKDPGRAGVHPGGWDGSAGTGRDVQQRL